MANTVGLRRELDPAPARRLRAELAARRRAGQPFPRAWREAVEVVCGGEAWDTSSQSWRAAFTETKAAWRVAYVGVGARLAISGELIDHEDDERSSAALVA